MMSNRRVVQVVLRRGDNSKVNTYRGYGARGESGAILILALVYIVAVSLVVIALAEWATNSLNNTTVFSSVTEIHYAATGVTNVAIESIRTVPVPSGTPTQGVATPLSSCWTPTSGTVSEETINGNLVASWCSTVEYLGQANTRVVTVYTCLWGAAPDPTGAQCQANPMLTAVVTFDDYPSNGGPQLQVQCNQAGLTCGEGITLNTWVWGKAVSTPISTISQTVAFYNSSYTSVLNSDTVVFGSGTYQLYAQGSGFGAITYASTTPSLCTVSALGAVTLVGAGTCSLTAAAAANTEYAASGLATFVLTISPADTTISVASSGSPSIAGQTVTYSATLSVISPGGGNPTDPVTFYDGGTPISSCSSQNLSGTSPDIATCVITYASSGSHVITVQYSATQNYNASSSNQITQTVNSLSYSGSTSANLINTSQYYGIDTPSSVGSTTMDNGLVLSSGIHLTGLTFSVPTATTSTFTATIGYYSGATWKPTMTCTIASRSKQCTATRNASMPATTLYFLANRSSGTSNQIGSWIVTYTQP